MLRTLRLDRDAVWPIALCRTDRPDKNEGARETDDRAHRPADPASTRKSEKQGIYSRHGQDKGESAQAFPAKAKNDRWGGGRMCHLLSRYLLCGRDGRTDQPACRNEEKHKGEDISRLRPAAELQRCVRFRGSNLSHCADSQARSAPRRAFDRAEKAVTIASMTRRASTAAPVRGSHQRSE